MLWYLLARVLGRVNKRTYIFSLLGAPHSQKKSPRVEKTLLTTTGWTVGEETASLLPRTERTCMHNNQGLAGAGGGTPQLRCPSMGIHVAHASQHLLGIPSAMNPAAHSGNHSRKCPILASFVPLPYPDSLPSTPARARGSSHHHDIKDE